MGGILGQHAGILAVRISEGDGEYPLSEQFCDLVTHLARIAAITQTRGQLLAQASRSSMPFKSKAPPSELLWAGSKTASTGFGIKMGKRTDCVVDSEMQKASGMQETGISNPFLAVQWPSSVRARE